MEFFSIGKAEQDIAFEQQSRHSLEEKEFKEQKRRSKIGDKKRAKTRDRLKYNDASDTLKERAFKTEMKTSAEAQRQALFDSSAGGQALKKFNQSKFQVGMQTGRAVAIGMKQQVDFSQEQDNLRQMFGHGEKIWGVNNEPVRINNDLNSSRSDPYDETAGMFGFGENGERSGLF